MFKTISISDPNAPGKAVETTHEKHLRGLLKAHRECSNHGTKGVMDQHMQPHCVGLAHEVRDLVDAACERAFEIVKKNIVGMLAEPEGCVLVRGFSVTNLNAAAKVLWPFTEYSQALDPIRGSLQTVPGSGTEAADRLLCHSDELAAAKAKFPELF